MAETRTETVRARDGHEFPAHVALPNSRRGPGFVVIQEIFGVNDYIKDACARLARLGYVALAPDLYSRIESGVAIDEREPNSLQEAFGYMQKLDFDNAANDAIDALQHLRRLPEVMGERAGILGFCLGGGIAYFVAARSDPDVCVSYYGSAVPAGLGEVGSVKCPILFHFGTADDYISAEQREAVKNAFEGRSDAEFHLHEGANHAFDNWRSPVFHHERAAKDAWQQTVDFLKRVFPTSL
jgi:carboxymethylenebutenolidase